MAPPAPGELFDGDLDVREAAAAVFVASQELEDVRSQLEAKEKESEDAVARSNVEAANLAADAIRDLSPADLDEVKAIRIEPPPPVQVVVCAVCSILEIKPKAPEVSSPLSSPPAASTSPTGGSSSASASALPPLSPRGSQAVSSLVLPSALVDGAAVTQTVTPAASTRSRASPILSWEVAQKRVGQKDFKSRLLSFDVRRLLEPHAAELLAAVRARIAVADIAELPTSATHPSAQRKKKGSSSLSSSWRAAAASATASAAAVATGTATSAEGLLTGRSSLATVAARARRASVSSADDLIAKGPLSFQDASYGSRTVGALFLWASRVIANVDALRSAEEQECKRSQAARQERHALELALRAAEKRLADLQAALHRAEGEARRRLEEARATAEAREREKRESEAAAEEEARRARAAKEQQERADRSLARKAQEANAIEAQRRAEMKAKEEEEHRRQEEERRARSDRGEKAVLEVVDVVIKQKVEFKAGSAVVEEVNVPALIMVADLMLTEPGIKVGVEAAPGIELAAERAEAIVQWLVSQGGVSISRLRTTGSAGGRGGKTAGGGGGCWHIRFNVLAEIKISDRLEFDGGSHGLRDSSKDTLRAVGKVLMSRPDVGRLTIEGHTCSDGPEQWNMQLSRERAQVVKDFLVNECAVGRDRLDLVGHGPTKPITEKYVERRANRRVEFLVL